jgi:hypothetical protein
VLFQCLGGPAISGRINNPSYSHETAADPRHAIPGVLIIKFCRNTLPQTEPR